MYELTGKIKDMTLDYRSGKALLTLAINEDATACFDELNRAEKLAIKLDVYRERRSLNANRYAWKLLTEIGNVTRNDKDAVYFEMLKRYGQSEMISVLAHVPISEYFKYCDEAGESTLNGKLFKHYRVYKGSSEFDSREMAIFIDGIVFEAKELGIQTETPEMIENIKSLWAQEQERKQKHGTKKFCQTRRKAAHSHAVYAGEESERNCGNNRAVGRYCTPCD